MRSTTHWVVLICGCFVFSTSASAQSFEHNYALVVGIDKYQSPRWAQLSYAVKDGQAIAAYLRSQGYDNIIALYDQQATKKAIIAAMQNILAPRLTSNDRVLIFFAGHGHTETLGEQDRGYIVPFDGGLQSAEYISMEELSIQSSYMGKARHQLFIMDSCYGGLLATRGSMIDPHRPDYLDAITKRTARQVITAGGKEQQVLDGGSKGHSFFVDYLLEALQDGDADLNGDGYVTFDELTAFLIPAASNRYQTPSTGTMPGHGGGEYWFKVTGKRTEIQPHRVVPPSGGRGSGDLPKQTTSISDDASPDCNQLMPVMTGKYFYAKPGLGIIFTTGDSQNVKFARSVILKYYGKDEAKPERAGLGIYDVVLSVTPDGATAKTIGVRQSGYYKGLVYFVDKRTGKTLSPCEFGAFVGKHICAKCLEPPVDRLP